MENINAKANDSLPEESKPNESVDKRKRDNNCNYQYDEMANNNAIINNSNINSYGQLASPYYKNQSLKRNEEDSYSNYQNYSNYTNSFKEGINTRAGNNHYNRNYKDYNKTYSSNSIHNQYQNPHYRDYHTGHFHHPNTHTHTNAQHSYAHSQTNRTNSISYYPNNNDLKQSNKSSNIQRETGIINNGDSSLTNSIPNLANSTSKTNSNVLKTNSNFKKKKKSSILKVSNQVNPNNDEGNLNLNHLNNLTNLATGGVNMNINLNNFMNPYTNTNSNTNNITNSNISSNQFYVSQNKIYNSNVSYPNIPHTHSHASSHSNYQNYPHAGSLTHSHSNNLTHNNNAYAQHVRHNFQPALNTKTNNFFSQYGSNKSKKPSVMKKLIFVNSYEKCKDFSNYKNFLTLNLKFLKQNYKYKENYEEDNTNIIGVNSNMMNTINNMQKLQNMQIAQNATIFNNMNMNYLKGNTNNNNNSTVLKTQNAMGSNNNNFQTPQNLNLLYLQMNMNLTNFAPANNLNVNINNLGNMMSHVITNNNGIINFNVANNLITNSQINTTGNFQNEKTGSLNPSENEKLGQGSFFVNPYLYSYDNKIVKENKTINCDVEGQGLTHNNQSGNNLNNMNNQFNNNNLNVGAENEHGELLSLRLQPYTFVKDLKLIEENLATGRFLKGVIRINKCHTHGYITVEGLVNDILIRGSRNLNQSLHLDEVIVELFPMVCWKPLFNQKIRKLSLVQKANEDLDKKTTVTVKDNMVDRKSSSGKENIYKNLNTPSSFNEGKIDNTNEHYMTDIDKEDYQDLYTKEENFNKDNLEEVGHNDNNNVNIKNNSNDDPFKDLDDEESISMMKFKENFDSVDQRLRYINKVYTLRPEGRIVSIANSPNLEKAHIVKIVKEKSLIFACPIDESIPKIFIKMKKYKRVDFAKKMENENYFKNKYFLMKIVGWAMNFKCPKGIIVSEMGNCGDIETESEVLLKTYQVDYTEDYPQAAMEELKNSENWKVDESILKSRVDLRNEIIFTIDPKHSKDLDDAISVKLIDKQTGLLEVGVHIADPSHFVTKDSLIDKEAIKRVTTVYLVHKNIPMLPRVLSEELCSLLPFKDRLAFSCVFRIYFNGALDVEFKPQFFLSIINSSAKWNYELVQRIINGEDIKYDDLSEIDLTKPKSEEIFFKMCDQVRMLQKLTKLVRSQRIQSGSLIIENDEIQFDLDPNNKIPIGFKLKTKSDSNNLIEELMLIANKLTAELLYDNLTSDSLIRKHPFLNDNKFQEIQRYLNLNKLNVHFEDPQALNEMLLKIKNKNHNKFICIQHKLKNFMQRAEYVIAGENDLHELRHSALNFDLYTHFTSPIRRYPDLVVHRQLKFVIQKLNNLNTPIKLESINEISLIDHSGYEKYIDHFNEKYLNGKMISSKCRKVFHCIFLKNVPGLIYRALVVDINYKNQNKNKRTTGVTNNNQNNFNNQNDNVPTLSVSIFIPELNLEIEWKKEDNPNILNYRHIQSDNCLVLDYKCEDNTVGNKTIKTFDEINVTISSVDSIPIDIKSSFVLTNNKAK